MPTIIVHAPPGSNPVGGETQPVMVNEELVQLPYEQRIEVGESLLVALRNSHCGVEVVAEAPVPRRERKEEKEGHGKSDKTK